MLYGYDTYGNIRSVTQYQISTATLLGTETYGYTNASWLDRLTSYNGTAITYDNIGNPLSYNNGSAYTFTWQNGRELAAVTKGGVTTSYQYGADGLRTQKTYGSTTYSYYYSDGRLIRQTWGTHYIDFLYDESGTVYSIVNDGTQYYFVKNLQGDVVQIRSIYGTVVVEYTYDAWGNVLSVTGMYADTLGINNPIRYRGYYYDFETGFYYLQSRYYDPAIRRFINADVQLNDGILGYNLFVYCENNPVMLVDYNGNWPTLNQFLSAMDIIAIGAISVVAIICSAGTASAAVGMGIAMYIGASATTAAAITTVATVGCYVVAAGVGICAVSNAGEVLTGTNVIRDYVMGGNQQAYDFLQMGLAYASVGIVNLASDNPTLRPSKGSKLEKYIDNPQKIKNVSPERIKKIAQKEGLTVGTLSKGAHAGQGLKVTWGGDRLLQYHPGGDHHGPNSYWKVSSGGSGIIRIFNDN